MFSVGRHLALASQQQRQCRHTNANAATLLFPVVENVWSTTLDISGKSSKLAYIEISIQPIHFDLTRVDLPWDTEMQTATYLAVTNWNL